MLDHFPDVLALESNLEITWKHGDDLCDCTFQRIGEWTNPYIARTMRVRFCCVWKELMKEYPDLIQEIEAFYDYNEDRFVAEPREWDSEDADMPRALWYRQIQAHIGGTLDSIRHRFAEYEPPKRVRREVSVTTANGVAATEDRELVTTLSAVSFEAVMSVVQQAQQIGQQLAQARQAAAMLPHLEAQNEAIKERSKAIFDEVGIPLDGQYQLDAATRSVYRQPSA